MSKAFVIKNKEGKYWRSKFDKKGNILLTDDIVDAMPYEEDELKMLECPKDCTIVPITICEGDIEGKAHILDKALKMAVLHLVGIDIAHKLAGIENIPVITDFDYFIQQAKESEEDE